MPSIFKLIKRSLPALGAVFSRIYVGRRMESVPEKAIVFFPCRETVLCCGLAGIVSIKPSSKNPAAIDISVVISKIGADLRHIDENGFHAFSGNRGHFDFGDFYFGGADFIDSVARAVRGLKNDAPFFEIYKNPEILKEIDRLFNEFSQTICREESVLLDQMGRLDSDMVKTISKRIEAAKDIAWFLKFETVENIKKTVSLGGEQRKSLSLPGVSVLKKINSVLNGIDRLEVRGRDSAGISVMLTLSGDEHDAFSNRLAEKNQGRPLKDRLNLDVLLNKSVSINHSWNASGEKQAAVTFVYKIASEIGRLGENVDFIRRQIAGDDIFQTLISLSWSDSAILAHTRWASVGAITEANCHPVDNKMNGEASSDKHDENRPGTGIIHVCLNGDIDNYKILKKENEDRGRFISPDITTDTKLIPFQIQRYLENGQDIEEAFRLAVNDFSGSHAIAMQTDLSPGRLFLAQRGSGQAIFVGIADEHYMPASEVYGFVEETSAYVKMNDENAVASKNGGQMFILNEHPGGGLGGRKAMHYDKTPFVLEEKHVKQTRLTSRDIDRQNFDHYFLKEISQAPASLEKTIQNRWKIVPGENNQHAVSLNENEFPESLAHAIKEGVVRRVFFMGQGTAGVAAKACAGILNYYINDPHFHVAALKSSELSGFNLNYDHPENSMDDALVIAISQSGTTTDTNLTVDMVRERGARAIAIVNRRDSDITFKVDGVMHTSSGRDIEMSVASTKAFYSQIVAGALLSLNIASLKKSRGAKFISEEIQSLLALPGHMKTVFGLKEKIKKSAQKNAVKKTYWAVVGSGPNKASADEIRIKLSELCYKTISSDFVEDKKHIDLSSEPLIIVCAAGVRKNVIGDIIKDTAIFRAHKSAPIVIADEGERRFDAYAHDVFNVPAVSEHLAPVLNTLAGHLWGYYAALAINEASQFFHLLRQRIKKVIDDYADQGMDVFEIVLETGFKEEMTATYNEFRRKLDENSFSAIFESSAILNLGLLLKYLSGRLPVLDFEIDFGEKGTASNMIAMLFKFLGELIQSAARPVDAIKHQAKTVTVGTSRIAERLEGILFDSFRAYGFHSFQLINRNVLILKNIQGLVKSIEGAILYKIDGLNLMGAPTENTTIQVLKKEGSLKPLPSRVESDSTLKGTKRLIVIEENVYIGKGRKDDRNIIVAPFISTSPTKPNRIEHLLLLNVLYKTDIPLKDKIKGLGGKYERIKSIVHENSVTWRDDFLELIETNELFGVSAEKIADFIVSAAS